MRYVIARRSTAAPDPTTALGISAATLSPGQCRLFGTISQAVIQCGGENAPMTKYGSSGVWDPIRGEVGFIGKRDSSGFPYHWLMYTASTNAWASLTRAVFPGGSSNQNGHGYDHNACDPATGTRYHRPYDDSTVWYWDGSWASLTALPAPTPTIAGFLTWFPGIGLIYGDRRTIRRHPGASNPGASWVTIEDLGGSILSPYHGVGEYNPNTNTMVWGAGNTDNTLRMMNASQVISSVPTPPFNCGSSELQGLLCAFGNGWAIWEKATSNWAYWEPGDLSWTPLTQSTGSGTSPQNGMPNLATDSAGRHSICIPIEDHDIAMFVQARGTNADVWIAKAA